MEQRLCCCYMRRLMWLLKFTLAQGFCNIVATKTNTKKILDGLITSMLCTVMLSIVFTLFFRSYWSKIIFLHAQLKLQNFDFFFLFPSECKTTVAAAEWADEASRVWLGQSLAVWFWVRASPAPSSSQADLMTAGSNANTIYSNPSESSVSSISLLFEPMTPSFF